MQFTKLSTLGLLLFISFGNLGCSVISSLIIKKPMNSEEILRQIDVKTPAILQGIRSKWNNPLSSLELKIDTKRYRRSGSLTAIDVNFSIVPGENYKYQVSFEPGYYNYYDSEEAAHVIDSIREYLKELKQNIPIEKIKISIEFEGSADAIPIRFFPYRGELGEIDNTFIINGIPTKISIVRGELISNMELACLRAYSISQAFFQTAEEDGITEKNFDNIAFVAGEKFKEIGFEFRFGRINFRFHGDELASNDL